MATSVDSRHIRLLFSSRGEQEQLSLPCCGIWWIRRGHRGKRETQRGGWETTKLNELKTFERWPYWTIKKVCEDDILRKADVCPERNCVTILTLLTCFQVMISPQKMPKYFSLYTFFLLAWKKSQATSVTEWDGHIQLSSLLLSVITNRLSDNSWTHNLVLPSHHFQLPLTDSGRGLKMVIWSRLLSAKTSSNRGHLVHWSFVHVCCMSFQKNGHQK